MASFHFYLKGVKSSDPKTKQSSKETLISLYLTYKGQRVVFSTGLKVAPKNWSFPKERSKPAVAGAAEFNQALEGFRELVERTFHELSADGVFPSKAELKAAVLEARKEGEEEMSFFEYFQEYIDEHEGVRTYNTLRNYRAARNHLLRFEKHLGKPISFASIDQTFYNKLIKYFTKLGKAKNTMGDVVKNLKAFMKYAKTKGHHQNLAYLDFKVLQEESQNIYLNEKELGLLYGLDLSAYPGLDRVRDLFIVGAWTGLRFSDLEHLRPENISGNLITIKTQKTGELVTVPVHPLVLEIIEKYDGQLPPSISNQKMNAYLKEIGAKAAFDAPVTKSMTKGGERVTVVYQKFELLTTHTARRSFATNNFLAGFPSLLLMKITGHKTERAFMKYIKADGEVAARKLAEMYAERWKG